MELYSVSKGLWHLDRLKKLQEGKPIAPTLIQVDPQAYCNDNCSFCSYRISSGYNNPMLKLLNVKPNEKRDDFKPLGMMTNESGWSLDLAEKIPKQMKEADIPAIEITGGGEPTLWNGFDKLIEFIEKYEREYGLVTNGSNLSEKRIKLLSRSATWVRISMDASNPKTHRLIHRTTIEDFNRRIQNIESLIRQKRKSMVLGISFIVTPDNYSDTENSIIFYKKLGVSNIRFSFMYDKGGKSGLTDEQIERITVYLEKYKEKYDTNEFRVLFERGRIDTYSKPNDDFTRCYVQQFVWAIGADYMVYPCCIEKYIEGYGFADIRKNTLKEIIDLIHQKQVELKPIKCSSCWLRNRNKAIALAVEKPQHHNFV